MAETKTAIEQLSSEEPVQLVASFRGSPRRVRPVADWNDQWDQRMKRDIAAGKFTLFSREVDDDIEAVRLRDMARIQNASAVLGQLREPVAVNTIR